MSSRRLLIATVFCTGACVLIIEIMGTRVLAPLFGSGIGTWSALIAVTLAALALGYGFGGRTADRWPRSSLLYTLCGLAGLWTLVTPALARWLLPALLPIAGERFTVLLAAALLFIPNLFLLGTMGPFVIRLLTRDAERVGSSSGAVFAASTAGSLLGALATGFVLIPLAGTGRILVGTALALMTLSVVGLRGRMRLLWLAVALAAAGLSLADALRGSRPEAGRIEVLEHRSSFYGELHVVGTPNLMALLSDGVGQNIVQRGSEWLVPYLSFLAQVPKALGPDRGAPGDALVIGLGAGQLPMRLEEFGMRVTSVEIDPEVVGLARRHFGYDSPEGRTVVMDGRKYLARSDVAWDYIVLDVFNGEQVPWHLVTKQAFERVRAQLAPGGVLGVNYVSLPGNADLIAVKSTLDAVFPHVRIFLDAHSGRASNFVFLASNEPIDLRAAPRVRRPSDFEAWRIFVDNEQHIAPGTLVLTDDHNPIEDLRRNVHKVWRASMREWLGQDGLAALLD